MAYWKNKESVVPHFNFGIPVASQPFYRPAFGVAQNLTTWTKLEKIGFPLRINVFGGVVYMRQQTLVKGALKNDRAIKPIVGIEVPVSSLASKLGIGGGSQGGSQGGSKGSSKGGSGQ